MAKIYTKLTFDGAKEYTQACHQINNSLKVLGAELKLVAAEYGRNDTSLEGLTRKQDVLKQKFEEQAQKVRETEQALKALEAEGTASAATFATFETRLLNGQSASKEKFDNVFDIFEHYEEILTKYNRENGQVKLAMELIEIKYKEMWSKGKFTGTK